MPPNDTEMFEGLFEPRLTGKLQPFNAITVVEKDIILGIVQSQEFETLKNTSMEHNVAGKKDYTSNAPGPSYDSAFIVKVPSSISINDDIIFDSPNGNVNMAVFEKVPHVLDLILSNSEISLNVRDTEDTLDDASKRQQKRDIKEMKDVFESTESELCELEKQNDFLKDQFLEVSLKQEVELSVLLNHECVDNSLHAEIEQIKKKSIEIQEGLQARIKILEKDVQRCEKQTKKVAVYVRKNKQTDNTSENVISNKENVIDVDVANASKAKTLLCVSCMQNVLIPCHDKFLKTRFSEKSALSKSLDTTFVVSKPKMDVGSASQAKNKVVQIVLWIVDSGCSKHMTGDRSLLKNFIEKFIGTVRLGNDNFAAITGYGDYIQGNITIFHVYYVEGLGHNLFSVGQFCDGDLEVSFRSKTCYVRNLEGDDLLTGGRESNLYTISISNMAASSPVCIMSKATLTKSWLWHRRLSHLNFGTINDLTGLDLVDGLLKFKYGKDHLCSA
ncbi:integrase, catalytic region, zinc finger, CCHC-type containing protein, partial [Tanacetum coccineum]